MVRCQQLFSFLIFLLITIWTTSATQRALIETIIQEKQYDVNEWPHMQYKKRTDVHVQLFINSFGSLNAANMDFNIDVYLRQRWQDPRLAFSSLRESITISDPRIRDKIWKPDTYFENVKDAEIHMVTMPNILLRINRTGDILYSMRITMKLSCSLQLQRYPFDAQICHTALASYANTDDVIKYHWEDSPIDIPDNLEIAQFDFLSSRTYERTYSYVTGNFSGLQVSFSLRRQNGYHVLQTYIPTILIVTISWVSFWLDPNAVPGRVSLGVTTLLTLTTLAAGIRQQLPPVSYVKAIDVWVGMCMIMVFGALIEFTLVNYLANRKIPPDRQAAFKIPKLLKGSSGIDESAPTAQSTIVEAPIEARQDNATTEPVTPKTYLPYARALDRLCRAAFPGLFLLFNIFYWPYYLLMQYNSPIV